MAVPFRLSKSFRGEKLRVVGPQVLGSTATYNYLLRLCLQENLGEGPASGVYSHLGRAGLEADGETYGSMVRVLCRARNVAKALVLLSEMPAGHAAQQDCYSQVT